MELDIIADNFGTCAGLFEFLADKFGDILGRRFVLFTKALGLASDALSLYVLFFSDETPAFVGVSIFFAANVIVERVGAAFFIHTHGINPPNVSAYTYNDTPKATNPASSPPTTIDSHKLEVDAHENKVVHYRTTLHYASLFNVTDAMIHRLRYSDEINCCMYTRYQLIVIVMGFWFIAAFFFGAAISGLSDDRYDDDDYGSVGNITQFGWNSTLIIDYDNDDDSNNTITIWEFLAFVYAYISTSVGLIQHLLATAVLLTTKEGIHKCCKFLYKWCCYLWFCVFIFLIVLYFFLSIALAGRQVE